MYKKVINRKIRIAVVGCGRISKNHFASIEKHDGDFELVAICDINQELLDQKSRELKVPGFKHLAEMLKAVEVDLVSICTPSGLHPEQTILAAKHGVHVMTEKPMATRWKDGMAMVKACDEANVRLFVIKQNRRNSTLQLLKRAITEKRFGRIHMVTLNVFWTRPQEYYDSAK